MSRRIVLFQAADGRPSARLQAEGGAAVALFSAYQPGREAERFIKESLNGKKPPLLVILGAGLGLLETAAEKLLPETVIVSIPYAAPLLPAEPCPDWSVWRPDGSEPLSRFLERAIGEHEAGETAVVEWPAAARAFPEASGRARAEVLRVLKENSYGALTAAAGGRQWLRNTIVNYLRLDEPLRGNPLVPGQPLVIAAAGPSLARALPILERERGRYHLWAVASSLPALRSRALAPELVAATDGGFWASFLLAASSGALPLLAQPLSAARGAWRTGRGVWLFAQPNVFESELFLRSGVEVPVIGAHGTVAGTALLLARACGARDIFFCGLDCCYDDIRSHVSPHPYEALAAARASRFAPALTEAFRSALELAPRRLSDGRARSSETLAIYASSFRTACAGARVRRLFPSRVAVPGMEDAAESHFTRSLAAGPAPNGESRISPIPGYPGPEKRKRVAGEMLDDWATELENGRPDSDLSGELTRFFGRRIATAASAAEAATSAAEAALFLRETRRRFIGETVHA